METISNLDKICQNLLEDLQPRQKEIILRRFGLETGKRETLEAIGMDHNITRERVRQIEATAIAQIQPKLINYEKIFKIAVNFLKKWGNLKREDILLFQLGGEKYQPHLYFLLTLSNQFSRFGETDYFYSFWTIDPNSLKRAQKVNRFLISELEKKQNPFSLEEISELCQKKLFSKEGEILNSRTLLSFIEISKEIEEGIDNLFGLKSWPEINPRGIRDKAYLVLKKTGKPLHFREVASLISKLDFPRKDKEKAILPQTVHNELIRDSRFVLVGRGIYALRDQGYIPGFVKDIIEKILREKKKPLNKEEIINEVLKQRIVKVNTILMNLQNKKYFLRNSQGEYIIRED